MQGGFVQIALEGKKEVSSSGNQRLAYSVDHHGVTMVTFKMGSLVQWLHSVLLWLIAFVTGACG